MDDNLLFANMDDVVVTFDVSNVVKSKEPVRELQFENILCIDVIFEVSNFSSPCISVRPVKL